LAAWAVAAALAAADDPKKPADDPAPKFDPAVNEALREAWPDRPDWVDMLADILQEAPMGPEFGWFRTSATQTRFDWEATRKRLDRDGDGRITREEFSGPDADFARLDRERDGVLTAADFDFSVNPQAPPIGAVMFAGADRDGNGKVTREEFDTLFSMFDRTRQGFLSQTDLVEALTPPSRPPAGRGVRMSDLGGPSKATLVRGLFTQELGSLQPGLKLDESATDFTLKTNDGKEEVTLSKLIGPRPVVLIFGNFTCGPFRVQAGNMEKLYHRYKDRATFLMVYVREAHPTDGWRMDSNDRVGVATKQPRNYEERVEVAQACGKHLGLSFPMLVDTIDDRVGGLYSGMPGRFYLIDRAGKIAFRNGRGPYGFKPAELEQSLVLLLQQEASSAPTTASSSPATQATEATPAK
jgi:hypothetical protein